MASPGVIERPDVDDGQTSGGESWIVTVFDNDYNTVEQVMKILMLATCCTDKEAAMETWEIHHMGRSVVHHGSRKVCEDAKDIIATIGIRVEVSEE